MYPEFANFHAATPYGMTMLFAVFVGWLIARLRARAHGVDASHLDLVVPISVLVGILMTALVSADSTVRLISVVGFGALSVLVYSLVCRLSFARLVDVMAIPTLAMIAVQRIGCFLAGCCWGDVSAHPDQFLLSVSYPSGSLPYDYQVFLGLLPAGADSSLPVYPVQLYEFVLVASAALVLARIPARSSAPGTIALVSTVTYLLIRIGTEFLRGDSVPVWMSLTPVQMQCLAILMVAGVFLVAMRTARSASSST